MTQSKSRRLLYQQARLIRIQWAVIMALVCTIVLMAIFLPKAKAIEETAVPALELEPTSYVTPEIMPEEAAKGGVRVMATGRSDYPNQINNVLAFPGIFRGTFDVHAKEINDEMKFAAATAIASIIPDDQIRADYIIPEAFNPVVAQTVAAAVAEAAKKSGVTREYKTL